MTSLEVEVYNHQEDIPVSEDLLLKVKSAAVSALPQILSNTANGGGVIHDLEVIEVSIVNDATIAQVHVDFMNIPGATDVITFAHGEIVVSAETALSYGDEYGNTFERELILYVIHGLLHLAGHEDEELLEREVMEKLQFQILDTVWK